MKAEPGRYVRPSVFICDEYQAFASVGEDDASQVLAPRTYTASAITLLSQTSVCDTCGQATRP